MNNNKIVIAGGTGFIGQALAGYFGTHNEVVVLSRNRKKTVNNAHGMNLLKNNTSQNIRLVEWDGIRTGKWVNELEGANLLVNLAGKTVNCRYTEKNKAEILRSRVDAVNVLGTALRSCVRPPRCWVNASSATIYRHAEDHAQDEYTGEIHNDFSVQVCKEWEAALENQRTPFTRKIALRMAINLGTGGILTPYFNLLKLGLGGKQGSGRQMYSWLHIDDTCRIVNWLYENNEAEGVYNAAAPNPVTNTEFMRVLRALTGHRLGLPAYSWMLRAGGWLIGTEPELVLKSRWVLPTRLLREGFLFKYPELEGALQQIISKLPRKTYHLF